MFRPLNTGEPTRLGDYRIIGGLGEGGQGVVYLAEDPSGEQVAIKVLHARLAGMTEARERFLREVDAAMRVAAFCTARVLDVAVDGDRPYIVSEFIDGPSLDDSVRQNGPRSKGALDRIAVSTATALAAIHRAGVVHRDFKPSNVLLGSDGPRVIDFGIARAIDMTVTGGSVGTPAYMAPEVIAGEPAQPASDVFSWAVTVGFAATGRPSFGRDTMPAVMYRILHAQPDLDGVPEPLRGLLIRCLAKTPQERPTADEALNLLIGHDQTTVTRPIGAAGSAARPSAPPHTAATPGAAPHTSAPHTSAPHTSAPSSGIPAPGSPHSGAFPAAGASQPGPANAWTASSLTPPSAGEAPPEGRRRSRLLVVGAATSVAVLISVIVVALRTGETTPPTTARPPATTSTTQGPTSQPPTPATARPYGERLGEVALGGEVNTVVVTTHEGQRVVLAGSTKGVAKAWKFGTPPAELATLRNSRDGEQKDAAIDVGEVDGKAATFRRLQNGGVLASAAQGDEPLGPVYKGHQAMVYALAPAQVSGRTVLVSGDAAGKLHVWDPATGKNAGPQPKAPGGDPIFGIATGTSDGRPYAVTASANDTAQVWSLETGAKGATFRNHGNDVFAVATAVMDGTPVGISGGSDRIVRVWDLRDGKELTSFSGHTAEVACLAVGRVKGRAVVASGSFDGTVRVWDLRSGKLVGDPLRSPGGRVYSVVITEDEGESWLAAGDVKGKITGWSLGPASP
ncbi:serine/threonine-protein kinase [Nonomuraea gerenzanensis]|uniref:Tyrosine protein kinase:Serine/threonine protein kinase n=1 Tax=Nonomuraea gerenzanensis TaxID=93944 RepID=A0A1M4E5I8_9ACTN|nr:serine/threonine-protein kinase [Nonomuraea gerenzanensis]UBU16297.1 protein kinase [Nonomuraea gerenzanensis]SBO94111.1 Tyrosine protein kinase:Serine/threonine protein kinase [Nonomuraea gerenzanensis]